VIARRAVVRLAAAWAAAAAVALAARSATAQEPVTVFAAASLTDAVERIAALYEAETGAPLRLSFAASSTLARQIEAGAPADIYLSANRRWMDYLVGAGLIDPDSRVGPIGNSLVLVAPEDSPLNEVAVDETLDLAALVEPGARIAVADPDHTPIGLYAREALESLGLWEAAEGRLARTADTRAALALVQSGEAPLGIVYATDAAIGDRVKVVGRVPPDAHREIVYPFAVVAGERGPEVARAFAFLTGAEARAVFAEAGFSLR
jgi:molybdate transport system substrate-binding protein